MRRLVRAGSALLCLLVLLVGLPMALLAWTGPPPPVRWLLHGPPEPGLVTTGDRLVDWEVLAGWAATAGWVLWLWLCYAVTAELYGHISRSRHRQRPSISAGRPVGPVRAATSGLVSAVLVGLTTGTAAAALAPAAPADTATDPQRLDAETDQARTVPTPPAPDPATSRPDGSSGIDLHPRGPANSADDARRTELRDGDGREDPELLVTSRGMDLPDGGWLTGPVAAAIAAAATTAWLRWRRSYQSAPAPAPSTGPAVAASADPNLASGAPTVATVIAAVQRTVSHPTGAGQGWHADGPLLPSDLPAAGVVLTGPGAADAARGLLISALLTTHRSPGSPVASGERSAAPVGAVVTAASARVLLGADYPITPPATVGGRLIIERPDDAGPSGAASAVTHAARQAPPGAEPPQLPVTALLRSTAREPGVVDQDLAGPQLAASHPPAGDGLEGPERDWPDLAGPVLHVDVTDPAGSGTRYGVDVTVALFDGWPPDLPIKVHWWIGVDGTVTTLGQPTADTGGPAASPVGRLTVIPQPATRDLLELLARLGTSIPGGAELPDPTPSISPAAPPAQTAVGADRQPPEIPVPRVPLPATGAAATGTGTARLLRVAVLGEVTAHAGAAKVAISRTAGLEILVLLATCPDGVTSDDIMDAVWPHVRRHAASRRFHTTMSTLRRELRTATRGSHRNNDRDGGGGEEGREVLIRRGPKHLLDPGLVEVDLWQLQDAARRAGTAFSPAVRTAALHQVIGHYRGELAAGRDWPWLHPAREQTRRQVIDAYTALAVDADPATALALTAAAVELDPINEPLYRAAMRAHAANGDPTAVRHLLQVLTRHLAAHGMTPNLDTVQLVDALTAGRQPASAAVPVTATDR